jgi:5-methyltetrahydropteroyltriglutamate--homocysteine methyltransferase
MAARTQGHPPFRADHIGSLLRPPALRQAFRHYAANEIDDAEFSKLQDRCIRDVVALQEQVGLKVVTDGEFRRGSYWGRFVERIDGFEIIENQTRTIASTRRISFLAQRYQSDRENYAAGTIDNAFLSLC